MKKPVFAPYSVNRVGIQFVLGLLLGMILLPQAFAANCTATYTYTSTGGSANYTLNAGQSLKIVSGTYTGALDGFASGSSVCVETGATFNPSNINIIAGTLTNYGTTILQTFVYNAGAVIDNYGTLTFPGGLNTNGITTFRNRTGATMNMDYSFQLGKNSTFVNDGLLVAKQDFNTENGTTLINNHRLELEGNFNPDGKFDNYGRVYAKAFMNINLNSDVTNYCTLVSWGGFNNNSALMDNQGTILITSAGGTPGGLWQNNKPFQNGSNAKIAGGDFTNNDSFTGGGQMIFAGFTRNNGTFTGNSSSDKITFYDETQTGSQLFDVVSVAAVNTVRAVVIRPTELDSPSNCSSSYKNFANPVVNDYGDAPASYGDAGHAIVAGIHMGTKMPDAEAASQYSFNASADGAEDDGAPHPVSPDGPATVARFPVLQANASSYSSPFTVTNTTGTAGKLYGWIDFDKSGTFEADEAASVAVPSGSSNVAVTLTWNSIPTNIKIGTTFIRLRLTTDTAVTTASPTGSASNGEVEDYPLAIYQPVPTNSVNLKIINGITPSSCQTTVFSDNFNDLTHFKWGALAGGQNIRNWVRAGGGTDTYAEVEEWNTAPYYSAIYFGNGALRGVYPPIPNGFTFDADGKLTSTLTAVALRDVPDDLNVSHWGPNPVTLSTSVPTQVGKAYRLYFKAIPETDSSTEFADGIMRVDITGSTTESIHFKAPGSKAAAEDYAIEFTATAATTTVTFVNYGHVADIWCDPQTNTWCTEGGIKADLNSNELIIDDVVVAAKQDCGNDYGDAPASYGTPSHTVVAGSRLGATIDSETAAQPTPAADGDGADEDGITFNGGVNGYLIHANTSTSTANTLTVNASTAGFFSFWIDYNANGVFDAAEQVFNDQAVVAGDQTLNFNVPTTAVPGLSYARARFSSIAGQANLPTGAASNGEVEDYQVKVQKSTPALSCTSSSATYTSLDFRNFERVDNLTHWVRKAGVMPDGTVVDVRLTSDGTAYWDNTETAPADASTSVGAGANVARVITLDVFQTGTLTPVVGNFILSIEDIDGDNRDTSPANGVGDDAASLPITSYSVSDEDFHFYNLHNFALDSTTRLYQGAASNPPSDIYIQSAASNNYDSAIKSKQLAVRVAWENTSKMVMRYYSGQFANMWIDPQGYNTTGMAENCNVDRADTPSSYGETTHAVIASVRLGANIDADAASIASAAADGDGTDDDGITLPAMTKGQTASITATVAGAGGYLQGWIDFNGDGDFADAGEQVATNIQDNAGSDTNATAGTITFSVNVPAGAVTSQTYARFRWSTAINLDSTSAAANGEVEDYTLTIASASCSLIVTTTADTDNASNNSGSLRDAMECANNRAGGDTITFNMPTTEAGYNATTGVWTIKPLSPLPVLSGDSTYIDATSQAGANCGDWWAGSRILKVQLDGAGLSATTDGLVVEGDNFALRGMSITRFPQNGISFKNGADNALIACDHIGVAADGITSGSNKTGLSLAGTALLVGGMTAGDANVIAHNTEQGVSLPNSAGQVMLMRNSIHANGKLGIDLGVDNVTVNDANDTDSGANQLLNLPILNQVIVGTADITVRGCSPAGATLELFEADVSTGGSATLGDNQLGRTKDYGEGQRYLASFAENSAADIDAGNCALPPFDTHDNTGMKAFQLTLPLPANVAVGDKLTATAMLGSAGTSEFGPVIITEGGPPTAGGGSCAATGGTDILFIVDNSGSITPDEYADFAKTIQTVGTQLLADNPANRIGVAHFGGPTDSLVSGGQYVYFERDFSTAAMAAPVRQFGTNGAYNVNWWADHLAGAVQQIRYAIDGNTATSSSYIVSPLREMSRTTASPLQIVLMTDAVRYGDWVPSDISMLIDPPGSGAEPNDGSDFTVYNQLKADGIAFSVVSFNPNPVDIAASAAIASVGGTYTGVIDPNPQDPEGSQTTPRRYISVTSGFQLTAAQVEELVEGTAICSSAISGLVFEDVNYGGGAARPASEAGTVGITNATVEIYDSTGKYLAQTTTDADGIYKLPNLPDGKYYLRAVSDSVNSSRAGSNGTEIPVPTYPVIGGVKAAAADAGINPGSSNLNTSNFTFTGGILNGQQAQAVQTATLTGNSLKNVDFGFNFDTIVNANDNGQGSLRQFLLNANLLGNDSTLAQSGLIAGKENAILTLPTTDPNYDSTGKYWSIKLQSALPDIIAPMVLDSSRQTGFTSTPLLELNGNNAGSSNHGLALAAGSDGSSIRYLSITGFAGDGIAVTGNSKGNSLLSNNIYNNGGLGIDLGNDGVSNNDVSDTDSGANNLLNYPEVKTSSFGTNGSKIISYDFNLDLPANTSGYRLEFFKNTAKDPSGNGEGQTFIGSKDFSHPGGGTLNFKGTFNANQAVTTSDFISVTVTEKTGATTFGSTSEFSGSANNNSVVVCTSLIDNPGSALPDMMIDENATGITLLQTKDSSGNPVTYAITGGADSSMFTVGPVSGGTTDCAQIQFVKTLITKDASVNPRALPPGMIDPGDFEVPVDKDKDNAYDLEITATDSTGQRYARTLRVRVMDVNEAPIITSSNTVSVTEDTSTLALDIKAQDPDSGDTEGNGLSYAISGGTDQNIFVLDSSSGILNFKAIPDYDAPMDSNRDNSYEIAVTVTDHGGLTASKTFNIAVQNQTGDDGVKLQARVLLQGAYDSKTGLMSDTLNTLKLLPANQPYQSAPFNHSGTETISALVNGNTGNQSIVDWVLLDLRSNSKTTLSTRAILVQRDGNLVDAQTGTTTLNFAGISAGNYYVSVRHRNHLGVMTANPVSLGSTATLVDFSLTSTSVAGSETRYTSGKLALLWVGDINASSTLTCNGPGNDITNLLSTVLTSTENPQAYTNYILQGYLNTDINMDGKTLFSGPNNDANTLLGNVLLHPLNSTFAANYIVRGGLQ